MTTKYTDAPRTRVMTPASLNNGVHENHSIGQTMAIAPKKGLFDDISIPQIIAGAAAAATSVALASKIGIAGSVIGAAVSSVITVVSSQVYRHFISASAEAIKGTHAAVDYPAGAYEPVEPDVEEHLGDAATTQEMRQVAGRATTARVAPNSLRAKAAAERSQTQKKVIVFSIAIAIVAVIACAGAILITTAGEGLGINCADGPFGPLTVIGGRIYMEDGRIFQTMDSRFPTCTNGKKMTEQIRAALGDGAELRDVTAAEPFYIEADSPAILACINTYNEVTGENAKPFTMGGGTYARHFPYAVSFGPEHVDLPLPEFGGPMHGANEAAPIDKLLEAVKIYIIALLRLEEIDF